MARSKEELREAVEMLKKLNADEEVRRIAEAEEMEKLDRNTEIYLAKEEGLAEGKASGLNEAKVEIAKQMLKAGEKIETIMKYTGLTKEQIKKI